MISFRFERLSKKKTKWIFLFVGLLLILRCQHLISIQQVVVVLRSNGESVYSISMSRRDKRSLEKFFRCLMLNNDFGYTLLGNKPMSIGSYQTFSLYGTLVSNYQACLPKNRALHSGWKTWLKYRHHFGNDSYSLWIEKNPWIENGMLIVLADKKKVLSTIHEYAADFSPILDLSKAEELITEDHSIPFLSDRLRSHDGLIGTLFGYGRNNAWKFFKRQNGHKLYLKGLWEDEKENEKVLDPLSMKNSMLNILSKQHRNDISKQLYYMSFMVDPHSEETAHLKVEYRRARQKIIKYYEGSDFLEATLTLLKYGH